MFLYSLYHMSIDYVGTMNKIHWCVATVDLVYDRWHWKTSNKCNIFLFIMDSPGGYCPVPRAETTSEATEAAASVVFPVVDASPLTLLCDVFSWRDEKLNIHCPRHCHPRHISDRNLFNLLLTWLSPTMWVGHCEIKHFNLLTVQCHFQNIRIAWSQTAVLVHLFYWEHPVCITSNN